MIRKVVEFFKGLIQKSKVGVYHCPECGSTRVQGTAWIDLNSDKPTNDEPPSDCYFCPDCDLLGMDGHFSKHVCYNDGAGRCQWCKEPIKQLKEVNEDETVYSGQGA